jgi:hypothetical protein
MKWRNELQQESLKAHDIISLEIYTTWPKYVYKLPTYNLSAVAHLVFIRTCTDKSPT